MVQLNFSVCKEKLLDGTKTQTMRDARSKRYQQLYQRFISRKNFPIELTIRWSNETPCPQCGVPQTFPSRKGHYRCGTCTSEFDLPSKMYRPKVLLFEAVLQSMEKKKLGGLTEEEWLADGFNSESDLSTRDKGLEWFAKSYKIKLLQEKELYTQGIMNFEVFILHWRRV